MVKQDQAKKARKVSKFSQKPKQKMGLSRAKEGISQTSLAQPHSHRSTAPKKRKKVSKFAAIVGGAALGAIIALAPTSADAKSRTSIVGMEQFDFSAMVVKEAKRQVTVLPAPKVWERFEEGENADTLIEDLHSTREAVKKGELRGLEVIDDNQYMVPGKGVKIFVTMRPEAQGIAITTVPNSKKDGEDNPGQKEEGFTALFSFAEVGLVNPQLSVHNNGLFFDITLIDQENGRAVRLRINKSTITERQNISVKFMDEARTKPSPQEAFVFLETLPAPLWNSTKASVLLKSALEAGDAALREQMEEYDAGPHKEELDPLIDDFLELYGPVFNAMLDDLRENTREMTPSQRKQYMQYAEPYLIGLVMRPNAAWESQRACRQLDKHLSASLTMRQLEDFARKNNLLVELNYLKREIRNEVASWR